MSTLAYSHTDGPPRRRPTYTLAAAHLALGGLVGQLLSMSSHVMLANLLGSEGVGLFGLLGSFYATLFVPIIAGIPAGISGEVARTGGRWSPGVERLLKRTALWLLAAAVGVLLIGAWATGHIRMDSWQRVASLVPPQAFAPALAAAACGAILRGYFHATKQGQAIVAGQLTEQVIRLATIALLFAFLHPVERRHQLGVVVLAMNIGEVFGLALLWRLYGRTREESLPRPESDRLRPRLRSVFAIAAPASTGRFLMAVSRFVEAGLIPTLLVKSGLTWAQSMSEFGTLFGMAAPLLFFPDIVTGAMQDLLVPALAETHLARPALAMHRIQRSLLISTLLGATCYALLYFWGMPLADRLYPGTSAADYLALMAPLTILIALDSTLTGILRGLGKPSIPMWTDVFALLGRMFMIITLTPTHGMQAIVWALPVGWGVSVIGNLWFVGAWILSARRSPKA